MESLHNEVDVRPYRMPDLDRVLEIEQSSFPRPWSRRDFQRIHRYYPQGFLVAEMKGVVIGYVIAVMEEKVEIEESKILRYGHLLNLSVDMGFRRRGVGSFLLREILKVLLEGGASNVYLEVRVSNMVALRFYTKFDFRVKRVLRTYYPDGEDAYLMTKSL